MLGSGGYPICSFWADNFDPIVVHLNARDVTMVAVSRAPLEKLEAYNLVPKGRDEENRRPHWVRRHDEYASR